MHLIRYLSSSDENRLTVIEKKQERCKEASANSDATILNADGSKTDPASSRSQTVPRTRNG